MPFVLLHYTYKVSIKLPLAANFLYLILIFKLYNLKQNYINLKQNFKRNLKLVLMGIVIVITM